MFAGERFQPFREPPDEDTESYMLKCLGSPNPGQQIWLSMISSCVNMQNMCMLPVFLVSVLVLPFGHDGLFSLMLSGCFPFLTWCGRPIYSLHRNPSFVLAGMSFEDAVRMFNCNINYSGIIHAVTADGWFKQNKVDPELKI